MPHTFNTSKTWYDWNLIGRFAMDSNLWPQHVCELLSIYQHFCQLLGYPPWNQKCWPCWPCHDPGPLLHCELQGMFQATISCSLCLGTCLMDLVKNALLWPTVVGWKIDDLPRKNTLTHWHNWEILRDTGRLYHDRLSKKQDAASQLLSFRVALTFSNCFWTSGIRSRVSWKIPQNPYSRIEMRRQHNKVKIGHRIYTCM